MIRGNATFVTEKEIDLRPFDALRKPLSGKQFINAFWSVAARQSYAEAVERAMKRIFAVDKPLRRGYGKLFGSVEYENIRGLFQLHTTNPFTQ